jgi:hypothetical protein
MANHGITLTCTRCSRTAPSADCPLCNGGHMFFDSIGSTVFVTQTIAHRVGRGDLFRPVAPGSLHNTPQPGSLVLQVTDSSHSSPPPSYGTIRPQGGGVPGGPPRSGGSSLSAAHPRVADPGQQRGRRVADPGQPWGRNSPPLCSTRSDPPALQSPDLVLQASLQRPPPARPAPGRGPACRPFRDFRDDHKQPPPGGNHASRGQRLSTQ